MWMITACDLRFRRRQFTMAVVGAGLVFALTLILTGMSAGFGSEAGRTVRSVGADAWIVPEGSSGPFTALSVIDPALAADLRGAERVDAVVISPGTVREHKKLMSVNLIGYATGDSKVRRPRTGRSPERRGEAVVDATVGVTVGHAIDVNGRSLTVTGEVHGDTYFGGVPVIFTTLADARDIAYGGRPLATALITRGLPTSVPVGLREMSNDEVRRDLTRVTASARHTIASTRAFMWLVGAVIIGATTYVAALERIRDFAVLKAIGGSTRTLLGSVAVEAVATSLLSAAVALLLTRALLVLPLFTLPETITWVACAALPVVATTVGLLASIAALVRVVRVDPALAFG